MSDHSLLQGIFLYIQTKSWKLPRQLWRRLTSKVSCLFTLKTYEMLIHSFRQVLSAMVWCRYSRTSEGFNQSSHSRHVQVQFWRGSDCEIHRRCPENRSRCIDVVQPRLRAKQGVRPIIRAQIGAFLFSSLPALPPPRIMYAEAHPCRFLDRHQEQLLSANQEWQRTEVSRFQSVVRLASLYSSD